MSLYETCNPEIMRQTPEVKTICKTNATGNRAIHKVNFIPLMRIKKIMGINVNKKIMAFAKTMEIGIISRGKYTFFIRLPLSRMLIVDVETERLKKFHGKSPVARKIKNGYPLKGTFTIFVKINMKIRVIESGTNRAQTKPNIGSLYLTRISFHANRISSSLN